MRFYLLLTLVSGAACAFSGSIAALVIARVWTLVDRGTRRSGADTRARIIAAARLAPVSIGVLASIVIATAFLRFEPRDTVEVPGVLLCVGAGIFAALCTLAFARITLALRAAAKCSRLLRLGGEQIARPDGTRIWIVDSQYPVAAVIGIFRTRLLLSSRLMHECTESELEAIVNHERAHVRRRDNIVRAAMLYLPDPFAMFAAAREMDVAWAAAAEEAADDAAAGEGSERRTVLASALVRVARMASAPMPEWVGGLAFYEGHDLEKRVRRLLDSRHASAHRGVGVHAALAMVLFGCAALITEPVGQQLHTWMELALQVVP